METNKEKKAGFFETTARKITKLSGSTGAFVTAFLVIIIWLSTGPIFKFSDTWQLIINTGTTIVTFLMVFLIQRAANKDSLAIQLKLNELVAAHEGASNRLVNVEDLSENELNLLHNFYVYLAELSKNERSLTKSHSIDEAKKRHYIKHKYEPDGNNPDGH
ncbi:MAG: low affinity iron permease family protein [Ignavibacteriae bacterium]|nr:low affinity iron permease family protein [Ignavibacteriota bacterium]MCB9244531.1 low affinity iron permease family protein [Ignavibacteriales bacterium]